MEVHRIFHIYIFLLLQNFGLRNDLGFVEGVSVEEDLTLSFKEKMALDKFKEKVVPLMPHDYMKTDIYLIRWLRARNLDLQAAEEMLMKSLNWRKKNDIDNIEKQDWSYFKDDYPYHADTFDKTGRPIGTINIGSWDIRRAILAGRTIQYQKYLIKLLEEATQAVIREQNKGKLVTQWKVIMNMDGFNLIQHGCPLCLPTYTSFVQTYEDNYPGFADAIILINTPPAFQVVMELIRPLLSPPARKALKVYGTDKTQWQEYLDKEVSREQRRPEMGGIKKD